MKTLLIAILSLTSLQVAAEEYDREKMFGYPDSGTPTVIYGSHSSTGDTIGCRADIRVRTMLDTGVNTYVRRADNGKCQMDQDQGIWQDAYAPPGRNGIRGAANAEVDHVVALKEAWDSGANKWRQARREAFAFDRDNLVVTSKATNRSKKESSVADINRWAPDMRSVCGPARKYAAVKMKYQLSFTKAEMDFYLSIDRYCTINGLFKKTMFSGLQPNVEVR